MKLKQAIDRVRFTISKSNKPNEKDVEAFNLILEHFQKEQEKTIQENLLFAKLYAFVLQKMTDNYNDVDFANKRLNVLLSEPFEMRVEMLLMQLQFTEVHQNFADPILKGKTQEELKEVFRTHPKFEKEFLTCWDWWNTDTVKSHLETQINLSIQNLKNYV